MFTFNQEKHIAIMTTILVIMAVLLADDEAIAFFKDGAYVIYGIGLYFMWNNVYKKSKEENKNKYKKNREYYD